MLDPVILFFGLFLLTAATLTLASVVYKLFDKNERIPWEQADGVIEESVVLHDFESDPYLALRYKFFVDDQPYWGNQELRHLHSGVEEYERKYHVGKVVRVAYHPADPEYRSNIGCITQTELWSWSKWQIAKRLGFIVVLFFVAAALIFYALNPNLEWSPDAIEIFK